MPTKKTCWFSIKDRRGIFIISNKFCITVFKKKVFFYLKKNRLACIRCESLVLNESLFFNTFNERYSSNLNSWFKVRFPLKRVITFESSPISSSNSLSSSRMIFLMVTNWLQRLLLVRIWWRMLQNFFSFFNCATVDVDYSQGRPVYRSQLLENLKPFDSFDKNGNYNS